MQEKEIIIYPRLRESEKKEIIISFGKFKKEIDPEVTVGYVCLIWSIYMTCWESLRVILYHSSSTPNCYDSQISHLTLGFVLRSLQPKKSQNRSYSIAMAPLVYVPPELEFVKFLGKGSSYGSVSLYKYSEEEHTTELYTAVKTSDYNHVGNLYKEFEILSQFKGCSRIVQCHEDRVIEKFNGKGGNGIDYMMLLEYASEGSLTTFMNRFEYKQLPDSLIRDFTHMLLEGLATIHERGYVHCDLKPENILVFPTRTYKNGEWVTYYELKISDFRLSKRDGDSTWWQPEKPFVGTGIYMSPESIHDGETGKGLDLWSLGCVVLEMYTGMRPYWEKMFDWKDTLFITEPLIPDYLPCDAKDFMMTCFAFAPYKRKDALTLSKHSFVRKRQRQVNKQKWKELVKLAERLSLKSVSETSNELTPDLVPVQHSQ